MKKWKENMKQVSNTFTYAMKIAWKYDKIYLVFYILLTINNTFSPFILVIFPKYILNGIFQGKSVKYVVSFTLIMFLLRFLVSTIETLFHNLCDRRILVIKTKMKNALIQKNMQIDYCYLEIPEYLDMKNRANQCIDDNYDMSGILQNISNFISGGLTLIGLLTIILSLNIWITLLIIVVVILNSYAKSKQAQKTHFFRKNFSAMYRKIFYIINATWDYKYAKEIRIYSLKEWLTDRKQKMLEKSSKNNIKIFRLATYINIFSNSSLAIQQLLVYIYLVYYVTIGRMLIGDFTMYMNAIHNASDALSQILTLYISLKESSLYFTDYINYMNIPEKQQTGNILVKGLDLCCEIEFVNVSFTYPNQTVPALCNISLKIRKGEKLSIVGDNGAGKTTLIKLLLRLYQPTAGKILLNGVSINEYQYEEYIRVLSVVFQDYKIFAFTVKENITFDYFEKQKFENTINQTGLKDKIYSLENKEETYMSKEFREDGIEFSGGEQQKVAIARALYKNSPVLILDEPTANLSPKAEYELYQQFNEMAENKTVIYISHRMSSCKFCDYIAVLSEGKIVEYGTHRELMQLNGMYYTMFQMQAEYYQST